MLGAQAPTPGNKLMALVGVLAEDADDRMHIVHVVQKCMQLQSSNDNEAIIADCEP